MAEPQVEAVPQLASAMVTEHLEADAHPVASLVTQPSLVMDHELRQVAHHEASLAMEP